MGSSVSDNSKARRAFADTVFRAYRAELHRFLVQRLRKPEAADDVMQEVFTRALRVNNPDYVRKPLSYLFGIAFHVISEHRIREDNERLVSLDSTEAELLPGHPALTLADEFPERLNLQHQLEKALMELPQPYRRVLLLCKRDGMTHEEAAAASGLSVHTVEKYLVRAKAMLMALSWDR
jgi:RNA polymerase sigma-70 factor (ECF subfamily)